MNIPIKDTEERIDVSRKLKEALFGIVGSTQRPVAGLPPNNSEYGCRIGTEDGVKVARLQLTFEDPENTRPLEDAKDKRIEDLEEALKKTSAALDLTVMGYGDEFIVAFKGDCEHYGEMTVSAILDEANAALEEPAE